MFDQQGNIYIEFEYGQVLKMDMTSLYDALKPNGENSKLDIDVVFINIINGTKVADIFKKLGVTQIFTF